MVLGTKLNQEIITPTDFNPVVINNPAAISNYNARLSVTQPVFNGGKEYIGWDQARLAKDASIEDRERTRQETVYNVVKAYYGLLLAEGLPHRRAPVRRNERGERSACRGEIQGGCGTRVRPASGKSAASRNKRDADALRER